MADRLRSNRDTKGPPGRESAGAMPRWVQVFGLIGGVLVVLFVILHLTGHGFGHHMHMPTPADAAPPP